MMATVVKKETLLGFIFSILMIAASVITHNINSVSIDRAHSSVLPPQTLSILIFDFFK